MTFEEVKALIPAFPQQANQEQYEAWLNEVLEIVNRKDNDLLPVDVNDANMNLATVGVVCQRYPDRVEKAKEILADVIWNAMSDQGGMVMGAIFIAEKLEVPAEETEKIMFNDLFKLPSNHESDR